MRFIIFSLLLTAMGVAFVVNEDNIDGLHTTIKEILRT
jgi:hypothetical protein